ncbi:tagaturonate epimerase family protein [Mucisphaera calidilacus]|uniref:Tagaturonate/fructuronate epimerase n=1 Tax=Mucisphaera calidilacus TaxID=2527982 RepID=A0A518BWY8_9BACT|nr:tagaturonate epimerase family protein [Mucisphaera calidilacus]QDU71481.1 hypothetical protein Pan265_13310 [Mucisphaera calidilacus]
MTTHLLPQTLGLEPSFGFGDRLGLATQGHVAALTQRGGPIRGIFAQQSIRELARTARQPDEVMAAATLGLRHADFDQPWGADADHLKTTADAERMLAAGFTFFTIDPSDFVDQQADHDETRVLDAKFDAVREQLAWHEHYVGRVVEIPNGPGFELDEQTVRRAIVKYGRAIEHAVGLANYIHEAARHAGRTVELEISVDETDQPTTVPEHFIIADRLRVCGTTIASLAPRFVGELEKGIDYKGDVEHLTKTLTDHAAIAEHLGPYKLSLHSGSDKLSMYQPFAQATRGRFHVKTAGTSYLEALRVVARHDPKSFREIITFSRSHYNEDRATYHVSATLNDAPPVEDVRDDTDLERLYLERWDEVPEGVGFNAPGRQILHCTFGSVLCDQRLGTILRQTIQAHPQTYTKVLTEHFVRHLKPLVAGIRSAGTTSPRRA